jgi:hypothetical protein
MRPICIFDIGHIIITWFPPAVHGREEELLQGYVIDDEYPAVVIHLVLGATGQLSPQRDLFRQTHDIIISVVVVKQRFILDGDLGVAQ